MDEAARERNALAIEMREGLKKGEFELFNQQQNDTVTREVLGFEVLLCGKHPGRGNISPAEFIPIAEKTGFIMELGEWVLRSACSHPAAEGPGRQGGHGRLRHWLFVSLDAPELPV